MRKFMKTRVITHAVRTVLVGLLLAVGLGGPVIAGTLYKWVGKNGVVHFSDQIPARDAGKQHQVFDKNGIAVKNIPAAKTPQQIAAEKRLAAKRAEQKRRAEAQAAHDRMLLDTFTGVGQIKMVRNGKIQAIKSIIGVTQDRINDLKTALQGDTREAARYQRSGKPVPAYLKARIAQTGSQIQQNRQYIRTQRQQQKAIRRRFAADIKRFKELQNEIHQQEQETAATPPSSASR